MFQSARFWLSLLLLGLSNLLPAAPACAQAAPPAEAVDAYVIEGMDALNIPGAAVALIKDGKVTHVKGFGRADSSGTPVTAQTPFQLGSISKSFAALVVLQLADEGKLSLDDPVVRHLPAFRTTDKAASDRITVRQLMNHRSGLSMVDGNRHQGTTYRGADAMVRSTGKLSRAALNAAPGERFQYSNANYALLAHLIEVVDQRPFEAAMEARIFAPLGMKNSFVQMPKPGANVPAAGHVQWFGLTVERDFTAGRMMAGPGGITASAEDLALYLVAVFDADPRVVPGVLTAAFAKQRRGGYESGWEFDTISDQKLIFHGGLNPGFRTKAGYTPETRSGALILTNMSSSLEGTFADSTVNYALGLPAGDFRPDGATLLRLWGTLGLTAALMIGALVSIRRLMKRKSLPGGWGLARVLSIAVPSLILAALGYVCIVSIPALNGATLPGIGKFYPDLGALLTVLAAVSLLWAALRILLLLRPATRQN